MPCGETRRCNKLQPSLPRRSSRPDSPCHFLLDLRGGGVSNYSEHDSREASRAFTGWTNDVFEFRFDATLHDFRVRTFLGRTGLFDGTDVIDIVLAQESTAYFIAGKLYRYFVRGELSDQTAPSLGSTLRDAQYELTVCMAILSDTSAALAAQALQGTSIETHLERTPNGGEPLGWMGQLADGAYDHDAQGNLVINIGTRQSMAVQSRHHPPLVFSSAGMRRRDGTSDERPVPERIDHAKPSDNSTLEFLSMTAENAVQDGDVVRRAGGVRLARVA